MEPKIILITGATDGIGLATARMLVSLGHTVLVHGRNPKKLVEVEKILAALNGGQVEGYLADLSRLKDVDALAQDVEAKHDTLDVLVNNAGVYVAHTPVTEDGLEMRFAVNAIAPYMLTKRLLPMLGPSGRVINLSSAAQSSVDLNGMVGPSRQSDGVAYAQSKLALTMWSSAMALSLGDAGPSIIAVNPRSFLGTKMVKEAYGSSGSDIRIGADILCRAALSDEFAGASGRYYDNDTQCFSLPHPDGCDPEKCMQVVHSIENTLAEKAR